MENETLKTANDLNIAIDAVKCRIRRLTEIAEIAKRNPYTTEISGCSERVMIDDDLGKIALTLQIEREKEKLEKLTRKFEEL